MLTTCLILVISVVVIYYSCELFVNGIEWVGKKFNIADSAVGSILAAFGTALPESVVTFVAVAFGTTEGHKDIGIGAALGGPLVLGTIAYASVGFCIWFFRKRRQAGTKIQIDGKKLGEDQLWFISIFIFKVLLGLIAFSIKPWLGILFIFFYGLYFHREMTTAETLSEKELDPLIFQKNAATPSTFRVILQTLFALGLIFVTSHTFVTYLEELSTALALSPLVVSLLLSPIATELPEILNAFIWIRQGKERLALANISGAMMIQATIPSALGLFFTPWLFDTHLLWAGICTLLSVGYLYFTLKTNHLCPKRLMYAGAFYLLFAGIFFI